MMMNRLLWLGLTIGAALGLRAADAQTPGYSLNAAGGSSSANVTGIRYGNGDAGQSDTATTPAQLLTLLANSAPTIQGTNFSAIPESAVTNLVNDLAGKVTASSLGAGVMTAAGYAVDSANGLASTASVVVRSYAATEQAVSATSGTVTIAAPTNGGNVVRVRLSAALTSALTLTLPTASAVREVRVEDEGGYSTTGSLVYVIRSGTDTVQGLTSAVPALAGAGSQTFVSDGASRWTSSNNTVVANNVLTGGLGLMVGNSRIYTPSLDVAGVLTFSNSGDLFLYRSAANVASLLPIRITDECGRFGG